MISQTLSLWGNGAVTLPKVWRDQFPTKHFIAVETPEGLLIKPIVEIEYYEKADGSFGLNFPTGIEAGQLLKLFQEAEKKLSRKPAARKQRRSHG